jgi:hypothetical protein
VRARKGYWALTAEEMTRATAPPKPGPDPAVTRALAAVETPSRAELVRTWVGMGVGDDGRTRVTLVWEPVPATPGTERRAAPANVSVVATGNQGPSYFEGRVPGAGALAAGQPNAAGEVRRAVFDAPPGPLQVRLSIEDDQGRAIDTDMLALDVPDLTAPVALSSLAVHPVRNALELRNLNTLADPLPVATREFRRTERLIIRFQITAPGSPAAQATLLNRAGQAMTTLPVQPVPNQVGKSQVDLPLASLPTGEYLVEVKATEGDAEAKQVLGFRVVG